MITPCFILLTVASIYNTQIMVNGKKIAAIYKEPLTIGTTIRVNNTNYEVKESPADIRAAIKKECN